MIQYDCILPFVVMWPFTIWSQLFDQPPVSCCYADGVICLTPLPSSLPASPEPYIPDSEPRGFFPPISTARPRLTTVQPPSQPTPMARQPTLTLEPTLTPQPTMAPQPAKRSDTPVTMVTADPVTVADDVEAEPDVPAAESVPPTAPLAPALPIRGDGFIPNSVLVRLLFPRDPSDDSMGEGGSLYRPPRLTTEQLQQIQEANSKVGNHGNHSWHQVANRWLAWKLLKWPLYIC